mmetsp:Transcript_60254/g.135817  ORF Transcript_60254/g.135817 Transcript_60254/m.135817 type:complete len:414 (-) Transcript_60254:70-1311(-)
MAARAAEAFEAADASGSEGFSTEAEPTPLLAPQVRRRRFRQLVMLGLAASGAAALASVALLKHHGLVATRHESAVQIKEGIKPFQQCGGKSFVTGGCCQEGCACISKTPYYSMCATPEGVDKCDMREAKGMAELVLTRSKSAKDQIKRAKEALEAAKKHEEEVKKVMEKRVKVKEEMEKKGAQAFKDKVAALAEVKEAKGKADALSKKAAKKDKEARKKKAVSDKWEAAEARRKGQKCAAQYQPCTGEAGCCVEGCLCVPKKAFFDQCMAPKGSGTCNVAFERHQREEAKTKSSRLTKESEATQKEFAKQRKKVEDLAERANKTVKAAARAGAKRVESKEAADREAKVVKAAEKRTEKAKQALDDARHLQTYGPKNAKAWKKVVDGTACEDEDDLDLGEDDDLDDLVDGADDA